jgi:Leucine-rich repeat (LRR) protein
MSLFALIALIAQTLMGSPPRDTALTRFSTWKRVNDFLSAGDLLVLRTASLTTLKYTSHYIYGWSSSIRLKLDSTQSQQYLDHPDSLNEYINARISNKKTQLHLQFEMNTMEEVDQILVKEGEYAAITFILTKAMWSSVEIVKEIVKKVEGKNKELNLQFIMGNQNDVRYAYAVIENPEITTSVVFVGEIEELYLRFTSFKDLRPLSGLVNLKKLDLDNTQVTDLTGLSCLFNLVELNLGRTQINDLTPLRTLVKLENVFLENTEVMDLAPLTGLVKMRVLYLENTQLV